MKILLIGVLLLLVPSVAANFGVGADFLEDSTLRLRDGETSVFNVYLQNTYDYPIKARVRISSHDNITFVPLDGEQVELAAGEVNHPIPITIQQLPNARVGDVYEFEYAVQPQITQGSSLTFAPGISRKVTVVVEKNPDKFYFSDFLLNTGPLWVLLVIAMGAYVWLSRHEKKK